MGEGTEELRLERLQLVGDRLTGNQPASLLRHQLNIILEYCYTSNLAMSHHGGLPDVSPPGHPLASLIEQLAQVLPAQGPISIFIHHNTLHAFEHLSFEEAVERAAERLGREPFLAESRYRDKLASGRILARDVDALLVEQLGASGAQGCCWCRIPPRAVAGHRAARHSSGDGPRALVGPGRNGGPVPVPDRPAGECAGVIGRAA